MKKPKELTKYGTPLSDEWNTKQDLADTVGEVDWDPFSNPQSVIKAKVRGGLDNGIDGFPPKRMNFSSDRGRSSDFCSVVTVVGTLPLSVSQAFQAAGWRRLDISKP